MITEIFTQKLIDNGEILFIGVLSSILATVFVLSTRYFWYKIISFYPKNRLFFGIVNSKEKCIIFQNRLRDIKLENKFLTPEPNYSAFPKQEPKYQLRQLVPYVLSAEDSKATAMVYNTLGEIGKTNNIQSSYVDEDYDMWENPQFLIGGNWKTMRVFNIFNPTYICNEGKFINRITKKDFFQRTHDEDLGLIQKVYNKNNNKPIWILMGLRGAGTAGAAYILNRHWKLFGKLYGKKAFGLIIRFDDKDGYENSSIADYYPKPIFFKRIIFYFSFKKLKRLTDNVQNIK